MAKHKTHSLLLRVVAPAALSPARVAKLVDMLLQVGSADAADSAETEYTDPDDCDAVDAASLQIRKPKLFSQPSTLPGAVLDNPDARVYVTRRGN